jgi:hypothetical protein
MNMKSRQNKKSEDLTEVLDIEQRQKDLEEEASKTVQSEFERLNRIIKHLIDEGRFILNERPEGMTIEDFRFIRSELNKKRAAYLNKGILTHQSSSIFFDSKTRKMKRKTKGITFKNNKS